MASNITELTEKKLNLVKIFDISWILKNKVHCNFSSRKLILTSDNYLISLGNDSKIVSTLKLVCMNVPSSNQVCPRTLELIIKPPLPRDFRTLCFSFQEPRTWISPDLGKLEQRYDNQEGGRLGNEDLCLSLSFEASDVKYHDFNTRDIDILCQISVEFEEGAFGTTELNFEPNKLKRDADFSDIYLICQEQIFPCHKHVLASYSPVFKTMILNEFCYSESNVARVELGDFEPRTVGLVLDFMYRSDWGCTLDLNDIIYLLRFASKYDISRLKAVCGTMLQKKLTLSNANKILLSAQIYGIRNLEIKAKSLIMSHGANFL